MIIEHIGIAVRSLEQATKKYQEYLGLEAKAFDQVDEQGVRVAMIPIGDTNIELLEPTSSESPIEKFLSKKGEGIHHIALRVDNIEESLEKMKAAGAKLIDESPRQGAHNTLVAFVHPSSTNGVLLELVEYAK